MNRSRAAASSASRPDPHATTSAPRERSMWARSSRFSSLSSTSRTAGLAGTPGDGTGVRARDRAAWSRFRISRVVTSSASSASARWRGPDRSSRARRTAAAILSTETSRSRVVRTIASAAASRASARALRAAASSPASRRLDAASTRSTSAPPPGRAAATTCTGRGSPSGVTSVSSNSAGSGSSPARRRRSASARRSRRRSSGRTSARSTSIPSRTSTRRPVHSAKRRFTDSMRPSPSRPRSPAGDRVEQAFVPVVEAGEPGLDEDEGDLHDLAVPEEGHERADGVGPAADRRR